MGGDTEAHSGKGLGESHHVSGTRVSADTTGTAQAPTALLLLGPHMPGTVGPGEKPPVAQTRAGGSLGQGGFPSTPFHSDNLQVGGNHTPNFTLSVTDNLLLKCLAINGIGALVHSLTTHCTPAAQGLFPGGRVPQDPASHALHGFAHTHNLGGTFPRQTGLQHVCASAAVPQLVVGTPMQGRPPFIPLMWVFPKLDISTKKQLTILINSF